MNKFKKCTFQWLRSVSVQSLLSVLKVAEKNEKTGSSKMFHRKKVSPDSKTEKPILQSTEKQIKGFILIIRFSSYRWLPHSWFKSYVFHIVFWPCELIFSANKTFVADEILTCQTVKCSENTYFGSTYVIFSVLNGQLKNKWLQAETVTLTFSANWIVRG